MRAMLSSQVYAYRPRPGMGADLSSGARWTPSPGDKDLAEAQ